MIDSTLVGKKITIPPTAYLFLLLYFTLQNLSIDQLGQFTETQMKLTTLQLQENQLMGLQIPHYVDRIKYITMYDSLVTLNSGLTSHRRKTRSCHWHGKTAIYDALSDVSVVFYADL